MSEVKKQITNLETTDLVSLDLAKSSSEEEVIVSVASDEQIELNSTFKITVSVESTKKAGIYLVRLCEEDFENLLLLSKTTSLCDFDSDSNVQTLVFELLAIKTGLLKLPEITVTRLAESRSMFT